MLPSQVIPAVIGADQIVRPGVEGLRYLAKLSGTAGLPASLPDQAVDRDMAVPRLAETCHTEWGDRARAPAGFGLRGPGAHLRRRQRQLTGGTGCHGTVI